MMIVEKSNSVEAVDLIRRQRLDWSLAATNYDALKGVEVKDFDLGAVSFKVQFNPARIVSSAARVDAKSIAERKCFLCAENRPDVQEGIPFGDEYTILVNPFPIFPLHLTIPSLRHTDQLIRGCFGDMLDLTRQLDAFTLFYNGPRCGASAPDHLHFQAGNKGFMPIEKEWRNAARKVTEYKNSAVYTFCDGMRTAFVLTGEKKEEIVELFDTLYDVLETKPGESEPMMNLLAWYEENAYTVMVFPRAAHRPSCYSAQGEENMLISPASVDMGGVFITPREEDFNKISPESLKKILNEVCLAPEEMNRIAEILKNAL